MNNALLNADLNTWLDHCLAQPATDVTLTIDGQQTHGLRWSGPKAAPLVLMVHGHRGHAHWWDFVAPALTDHFNVLAIDLYGMGDSSHLSDYSMEQYAQQLVNVIRAQQCGPVVVVAHSFGGRCAVHAAGLEPELFRALVAVDTSIRFADSKPFFPGPDQPYVLKTYPDQSIARQRYRLVPDEPGVPSRILDHVATHAMRACVGGWCWKFDERLPNRMPATARFDAEVLAQLRVPVHFIYGQQSTVVPESLVARIAPMLMPTHPPIGVADAGHHLLLSQPQALARLLREQLQPYLR